MKRRLVPANLHYLQELVAQGLRPVDIWTTAVDQDLNLVRVYLENGERTEFFIQEQGANFLAHYKEALEFCGFGPKGLASLVHAEALEFARTRNLPIHEVEVHLSKRCLKRVGHENSRHLARKLALRVSPHGSVLAYSFQSAGQREKPGVLAPRFTTDAGSS